MKFKMLPCGPWPLLTIFFLAILAPAQLYLGLRVRPLPPGPAGTARLLILQVTPRSPAAQAGLRASQVIWRINGAPATQRRLRLALAPAAPASLYLRLATRAAGLRIRPVALHAWLAGLRVRARQGDAGAAGELGIELVARHQGAQGLPWVRHAAQTGDAAAQTLLSLYALRDVHPPDLAQAFRRARQAAAQGYAPGEFWLGIMRSLPLAKAADYARARYWFHRAAAQGSAGAIYQLGELAYYGHGRRQNIARALYWYRQAAARGWPAAEYSLGFMRWHGQGMGKSYRRAAYWLRAAARQHQPRAALLLGLLASTGHGVARNPVRAVRWYRVAAHAGIAPAEYLLGMDDEAGLGTVKNPARAAFWEAKAAAQGYAPAKKALRRLQTYLPAEKGYAAIAAPAAAPVAAGVLRGKFFHMLGGTTTEIFHFHANGTYSRLRIMLAGGFESRQRTLGTYRIHGSRITLHFQQIRGTALADSGGGRLATAGKQAATGRQNCAFHLLPHGRGLEICGQHLDVYHF